MQIWLAMAAAAGVLTSIPQAENRGSVVGYVAAFKGLDREIELIGFKNYTQIDLAFVNPTPAGDVLGADGLACSPAGGGAMVSDAQLKQLVASAHQAGTKVVASLGGATVPPCGGDWTQLAAPDMREKVVANLMAMVDRYQLDGIDVDLEGELMVKIDQAGNYMPLIAALADQLHARSKVLTAATGSYPGGMIPDSSLPYFDLIGVMSYDQVGPTWGTPGAEHSSYEQAEKDLALWIGKGVPAGKIALGVPFYGRGFGTYREGWSLKDISDSFGDGQLKSDVVGERTGGTGYITYNGLPTLERKAELAGAWGAGVMVWEIGQDLPDGKAIRHIDAAYRKGRAHAHRR